MQRLTNLRMASIIGVALAVVLIGSGLKLAQATSSGSDTTTFGQPRADAVSTGDSRFDAMQQAQGIYFRQPTTEESKITRDEAIKLATEYRSDLAKTATNITAEFLLFNNEAKGIQDRPVWVVTFKGASVPRRGPFHNQSSPPPLPPVVQTQVLLDGLTGDIVALMSMGHK